MKDFIFITDSHETILVRVSKISYVSDVMSGTTWFNIRIDGRNEPFYFETNDQAIKARQELVDLLTKSICLT